MHICLCLNVYTRYTKNGKLFAELIVNKLKENIVILWTVSLFEAEVKEVMRSVSHS